MKTRIYKKILIINLGGIGDFLLSTPALRALAKAYPQASIDVMAISSVAAIAKRLPYINKTYIFKPGLKSILLFLKLRIQNYDLAVNMRTIGSKISGLKMRFIFALINARASCGRDTAGRGSFFNIKIAESDLGDIFEMEYDIATMQALGVQVNDRAIEIQLQDSDKQFVSIFLSSRKYSTDRLLVGIHPGGKPSHRWPIERFAAVMKQIRSQYNCEFVVTGSQEEKVLAYELERLCGFCLINSCGVFPSMYQAAELIRRCRLYITNDTGMMHVAAVLKVPMIAIFGPGYIKRYDPRGINDQAVVLHKEVICAPCCKIECFDKICLQNITVEEVINAIDQKIKL